MNFSITADHKHFFSKQRYIEFESLLSDAEAEKAQSHADALIAKRLHTQPSSLEHRSSKELFMAGRDLFRDDTDLKKIVTSHKFGEIGSTLFNTTPLRLAYDQYLHSGSNETETFLNTSLSLEQMSSLQPIVGGLILRLSDETTSLSSTEPFCPLPERRGNGIFISPELILSLAPLFRLPSTALWLIAYCRNKSLYILQKADPHTHLLKRQGYAFGDIVKSATHPIVYRR